MSEITTTLRVAVRARFGKEATFPHFLLVPLRAKLRVSEKREVLTDSGRQDGLDGYGPSPSESLDSRRCSAHPYPKLLCLILLVIHDACCWFVGLIDFMIDWLLMPITMGG